MNKTIRSKLMNKLQVILHYNTSQHQDDYYFEYFHVRNIDTLQLMYNGRKKVWS